jgi:hypothetical protein
MLRKQQREDWLNTCLEEVNGSSGVKTRLLIDSMEDSSLVVLIRVQRSVQIKLEALSELVFELHLGFEDVGRGPGLGEGEAVLGVDVLGFNVPNDGVWLGLATLDLEGHTGGRLCLNLKRGTVEIVVLAKEVIGRLAEILVMTDESENIDNDNPL